MPHARIESNGVVYVEDSGERHPFSVVWTTLPLLSWIVPFIGHMGIADSCGVVHDFSGPYQVTIGSFMCGPAKRVWRLDLEQITTHDSLDSTTNDGEGTGQALDSASMYDRAVAEGAMIYGKRMHNLVCDNCHSHVATILNMLRYEGRSDWNQLRVCWKIWMKAMLFKSILLVYPLRK
ncbi:hypothetical protein BWQ96_08465 [Gracilariopsis chorda]|uniref:Transmembrane protein 222 n=1 Tax=Gracilariopsis chorda TaxID=448386 RepID=A0A2V3IIA7_9FLOR|nr:hypothetical protein BWQ96_08465 [Gracilariopsis chorda]|eukprot:PXF41817.1 hypothetical protein BWQ96_08465 [Gracilariopsis chorda]